MTAAQPSNLESIMMNSFRLLLSLALLASYTAAASASALLGESSTGFWSGFRRYWGGVFGNVSGAVLIALSVAAVGIFIILRGKKKLE